MTSTNHSQPTTEVAAFVIGVDPGVFSLEVWDATEGLLKPLQAAVGGLIERVDVSDDLSVWFNEEGLITRLPWNRVATRMLLMLGVPTAQMYAGPAVFTGGADDEGNTLGLSFDQIEHLHAVMKIALLA